MLSVGAFAEISSIPTNILGCKLGKTTPSEFNNQMRRIGGVKFCDTLLFVGYEGNFEVDGFQAQKCVSYFLNDSAAVFVFGDTIGKNDVAEYEAYLSNKYKNLQSADNNFIIGMMLDSLISMSGISLQKKSWIDDEQNVLIFMHNDSIKTASIVFLSMERLFYAFASKIVEESIKNGPDYDEKNMVTGVAGVKFGDSRIKVLESLNRRFGADAVIEDVAENEVKISNRTVGGSKWDFIIFYFKWNNERHKNELISVNLQRHFRTWRKEEAEYFFDNVKSQYSGKYTNERCNDNDEDSKYCFYGMIPEGYDMPPISVSLTKSLSVGGELFYYITVDYFAKYRSGRHNDDI